MMNERDRLIELLDNATVEKTRCYPNGIPALMYCEKAVNRNTAIQLADKIIADGWIRLPCKVGDKMYKLCSVNSAIKMGQMWDGEVVETNCDRCGYKNCSCYDIGLRERNNELFIDVIEEKTIGSLEFLVKIMPYVGKVWFTSKEEAEKALKGEH